MASWDVLHISTGGNIFTLKIEERYVIYYYDPISYMLENNRHHSHLSKPINKPKYLIRQIRNQQKYYRAHHSHDITNKQSSAPLK